MPRLSNDILLSLSYAIGDVFTAQQIKRHFSDYCIKYDLEKDLFQKKNLESKSDYCRRLFFCFDGVEQAGLIAYLAEQDERLKQLEVVQKSLYRLADSYGAVTLTVEERKQTTEIERLLSDFPECLELWKKSQSHYQSFQYRESLDNARLCVELFLKFLLGNSKSLENQRADLGRWLGERNVANEVENMVWDSIAKYYRVQNEHIKHDVPTELSVNEVIFVLDQTYSILKYLARTNKKEQS
ncbi:TPA: hypothetical protein U1Y72_001902 [Streptococcus suis]|nr:hypothetical protein [Streptococcus suis]